MAAYCKMCGMLVDAIRTPEQVAQIHPKGCPVCCSNPANKESIDAFNAALPVAEKNLFAANPPQAK